jgi:hypothetical protein
MANKGQEMTMTNIDSRLSNKQISSNTILHSKQADSNRALRETKNIPEQILLDMVMYLIQNVVDIFAVRSWIYLSSSLGFMALRRRNSGSEVHPRRMILRSPGLQDIKAMRDKPVRINRKIRHWSAWRLGRGGRGVFASLGSIAISEKIFMSRARIEIVGLRGCFDNPM